MDLSGIRVLIVGAGFWGGVLAERIAEVLNERVLVIERREHIGGNCRSYLDPETGIERHAYGTHIFHTKLPQVWKYITRFSDFTGYRHKVLTEHNGHVYPMPISLATINAFYNLNLRPYEAMDFIAAEAGREGIVAPENLEEKAVALIGKPLYEAFIRGYTQKQWEKDPRDLPPGIITRLPVRTNYSTDYFDDPYQGMPQQGYAALFDRLFDHLNIEVRLGLEYKDIAERVPPECAVFYSGAIDAFFDYSLGELEWRSLRFESRVEPYTDFQGTAVMNQADLAVPYTRTHEYKHLHPERGEQGKRTVIEREYPKTFTRGDEPYYPVNTPRNEALVAAYQRRLAEFPNVILGGRLGSYKYMDMDTTIASALTCFDEYRRKKTEGRLDMRDAL